MIRRKRTLVDVDDVLGDFRGAYAKLASLVLQREFLPQTDAWDVETGLTEIEAAQVEARLNVPGFLHNVPAFSDAIAAVKEMNEVSDVYFVTAHKSASPTWAYDRSSWLIRHFGKELGRRVVHTKHKHAAWGDFFIDDKPDLVQQWLEAIRPLIPDCQAYLRDWPYNRGVDLPRFNDWSIVTALVKEMARV